MAYVSFYEAKFHIQCFHTMTISGTAATSHPTWKIYCITRLTMITLISTSPVTILLAGLVWFNLFFSCINKKQRGALVSFCCTYSPHTSLFFLPFDFHFICSSNMVWIINSRWNNNNRSSPFPDCEWSKDEGQCGGKYSLFLVFNLPIAVAFHMISFIQLNCYPPSPQTQSEVVTQTSLP